MPLDAIIVTGDLLRITSPLMGAIIPPAIAPVPLLGTSKNVKILGRPVCLQGDELPVALRPPLPYTAGNFTIPGTGKFQLILAPSNITWKTRNKGKPLLLKGTSFIAKFQVVAPAQMPAPPGPPVPDPVAVKIGPAKFITTNRTYKAQ